MAWNYRPYAWYWYVDRRNRKEYKQKQEVLTVTIDNACTIHCAKQSHVLRHSSYCFFLAKCIDNEEHCAKVALSKANWVANCYCVAVTCHTFPRARICTSSATGTTWGKLEPPDSSLRAGITSLCICMDTESFCFVHTLANLCTPHSIGKLTVYL